MDDVGVLVKVLYFSQDYTPHDYRFLSALSKTGNEIFYLPLERVKSTEARPLPTGIQMVQDWKHNQPMGFLAIPTLWRNLRRVLEHIRPDLVHAGPVQKSAFLTALTGFQPLVTMSWGSDLLMDARRGWGRMSARFTLSRTAVLACDCRAVRDVAVTLGMPADRIVIFPWGVDLLHFKPGKSASLRRNLGWEKSFVLLSTRAWEPLYGLDVLIPGFIQAAKSNADLRLLLLGKGSLESAIRNMFEQAGMLDRVYFAGHVGYKELPDHYHTADVYVSASNSDGSSISLLEAMACGLPAVVSDIPGNREWVTPGEDGWWFDRGDPGSLSMAILESASEGNNISAMSVAARCVAEERANWQENFTVLLKAYALATAQR